MMETRESLYHKDWKVIINDGEKKMTKEQDKLGEAISRADKFIEITKDRHNAVAIDDDDIGNDCIIGMRREEIIYLNEAARTYHRLKLLLEEMVEDGCNTDIDYPATTLVKLIDNLTKIQEIMKEEEK